MIRFFMVRERKHTDRMLSNLTNPNQPISCSLLLEIGPYRPRAITPAMGTNFNPGMGLGLFGEAAFT